MASSGAWTYRDRTSEFASLSKTLKKIAGTTGSDHESQQNSASSTTKLLPIPDRSEFNKKASRIGLTIHQTFQKIDRLAKLAKRSSIFDDPSKEIQELTTFIKNDITSLNVGVSDLQALQDMDVADGTHSKDTIVHCTAICDDLKTRLMVATKSFQEALTIRTKNMKAHEDRKQIFSTNLSRENPLKQPPKTIAEPPPWSTSQSLTAIDAQGSNQLRRRLASDNPPSNELEMSMLQDQVPRQESYSQSRATALQNVESTISELGGIFTHLATMVAQQGELAIRIDDNVDESLTNVEGAQGALLKYLNRISSNRYLMIKIFVVVILFLCVFIFFLA
ncbi:syntaxin-31 [Solanum pennellii]|uniref:Syntaxin-31 n=1 Tax=Solanum pennellii TaxID=28526 RepID=A0ABM1H6G8_SOLPN|nr:syntaxin-31 [Solanum pennellii]